MTEVWRLLGDALALNTGAFSGVDATAGALLPAALGVAAMAAVSTVLGHVAVLLLNRIRGGRLLVSLVLSILAFTGLQVVEALVTWGVGSLATRNLLPLMPLVVVALTATAPLAFNFLTAIPHLGMLIGRVLQGWSVLVLVTGIRLAYGAGLWASVAFVLAGWLTIQLLSRLLNRPIAWISSRLWTLATGTPTMVTADDILAGMPLIPVTHPAPSVGGGRA